MNSLLICITLLLAFTSFTAVSNAMNTAVLTPNIDCQVSNWTSWSPCSGWCRTEIVAPVRVRFRHITVYPRLNGTNCPQLSEWQKCYNAVNCSHCSCLGCNNDKFMVGSSSWCRCCESGLGSGCNCNNNNYNQNRCIDQGWGTTYCQGYVIPDRARDYCRSRNKTFLNVNAP